METELGYQVSEAQPQVNGRELMNQYYLMNGAFAGRMETVLEDDPRAGKLEIDYRLYNGDSLLGDYKIRLQFTA